MVGNEGPNASIVLCAVGAGSPCPRGSLQLIDNAIDATKEYDSPIITVALKMCKRCPGSEPEMVRAC